MKDTAGRPIDPKVGEVWIVDLGKPDGHKQAGVRPFVITSNNKRNLFSPTIKGNPVSSRINKYSPVHVLLKREECEFLTVDSIVLCEETDTLNKAQFINKIGKLTDSQMQRIAVARCKDEPFLLTAFLSGLQNTTEFQNIASFA